MRLSICFILSIYCVPVLAESNSIEDAVAHAIIKRTNDFRESKELKRVDRNQALSRSARNFAEFMARTDEYGHRADGSTPARRAEEAGYDYCVVRENIAYRTNRGQVTSESLTDVFVSGWIDSPLHRENMLADYVTEIGVAVASSDGVTYYAVQLFGRPESESYQIELTNASDVVETLVIRANGEKNTVEIRPRMILKLTRCFPSRFSLENSDSELRIRESATLRIEDGELRHSKDRSGE